MAHSQSFPRHVVLRKRPGLHAQLTHWGAFDTLQRLHVLALTQVSKKRCFFRCALPGCCAMTCTVPCSCVRPDETSATVRCHYLRDGTAKFAFTVGRAEFFIPVGILLKCFVEASDKEVFTKLLATIPQDHGEPISQCLLLIIMSSLSNTSKQGQVIRPPLQSSGFC